MATADDSVEWYSIDDDGLSNISTKKAAAMGIRHKKCVDEYVMYGLSP